MFSFSMGVFMKILLWEILFRLKKKIKKVAQDIEVDEFIERLPGGYDFVVSERGSSISLGQRQLLSF